jgi:hypothetical protein
MAQKPTNIFQFLDWVLKKKGPEPVDENEVAPYIFNRWISMSSEAHAAIVNSTMNRWMSMDNYSEFSDIARFYHSILPKEFSRISYIKKPTVTEKKQDVDDKILCENMEISKREKNFLDSSHKEIFRGS